MRGMGRTGYETLAVTWMIQFAIFLCARQAHGVKNNLHCRHRAGLHNAVQIFKLSYSQHTVLTP